MQGLSLNCIPHPARTTDGRRRPVYAPSTIDNRHPMPSYLPRRVTERPDGLTKHYDQHDACAAGFFEEETE